jgi:polyhydroxyalkanoate depolymerase
MLYQAYQMHEDLVGPVRATARMATAALQRIKPGLLESSQFHNLTATYALIARAGLTHERPPFDIRSTMVGNREVEVTEEAAKVLPFGTLLHFKKDIATAQPRVLLIAPMSGHFATLLRGTVETLLPEHDVYITDWHNARNVALSDGRFDFDGFVDYVIDFLETIGPGGHLIAVCQPCVAALAAVAIMAEARNPAQPRSMTLMAGPIDARVSPTKVNRLAASKPIEWFEYNLIARVPLRYKGAMRRVYPGFVQLTAFMSMNIQRHVKAHIDLHNHIRKGDIEKAEQTQTFYDEYFAVADLPAEFYLQTVKRVFQDYELASGKLEWRGRKVDPRAIKRTALFTVEGEKDDICAVGQTLAAQDLCSSLRPYMRRHYVQAGVGHYGVFNGRRWQKEIYPMLRNVIYTSE